MLWQFLAWVKSLSLFCLRDSSFCIREIWSTVLPDFTDLQHSATNLNIALVWSPVGVPYLLYNDSSSLLIKSVSISNPSLSSIGFCYYRFNFMLILTLFKSGSKFNVRSYYWVVWLLSLSSDCGFWAKTFSISWSIFAR